MEFGEKLQALRKSRGLTQEELAENLFVTRAAVSKWESGRGYPSIDSIKDIAVFFSVTVDELLSSEKILSLAKNEKKSAIRKICNRLLGAVDLLTVLLIVLPLYPNRVGEYVYSVSLYNFTEASSFSITVYWCLFLLLVILGVLKLVLTRLNVYKWEKALMLCSLSLGVITAVFLILARVVYAAIIILAFLIIKGILYLRYK